MFLKSIDLTTALRPAYLPDEVLLFVQDNVGLYEGKYKLPNQQNGQVYLTSHRVCYVDKDAPRKNSLALDLKDVEKYEFYAGFLKSSPKVTLIPKPMSRSSLQTRVTAAAGLARSSTSSPIRTDSPFKPPADQPTRSAATWVCPICSFSNQVPASFDPTTANIHTPLPPCLACGIKPTLSHLLKASIAAATNRAAAPPSPAIKTPLPIKPPLSPSSPLAPSSGAYHSQQSSNGGSPAPATAADPSATFQCPRCTFLNHPSLLSCEICGAPLISQDLPAELTQARIRTESPGPTLGGPAGTDLMDSVKISFRYGGDKIFFERLKGSMTQRKWLLQGAPPIPKSSRLIDDASPSGAASSASSAAATPERKRGVGIAALEQRGLDRRKNNEVMIGSAFEDLDALMASAKEIVALAESFAREARAGDGSSPPGAGAQLAESAAAQLGLVATKEMVAGSGGAAESLYLSELARNLAEYLTDDARGVLRRAGGAVTLVDLWATFNRARGGVELVSPLDLERAARLWESLRLPVRLRTFRSGVMVVQARDHTDEATVRAICGWLADLHEFPPERDVAWDWRAFGRGVTARDAAERFGWSVGVAEEELEMAEEHGALCREEGVEGRRFWENLLNQDNTPRPEAAEDQFVKALKESGFL